MSASTPGNSRVGQPLVGQHIQPGGVAGPAAGHSPQVLGEVGDSTTETLRVVGDEPCEPAETTTRGSGPDPTVTTGGMATAKVSLGHGDSPGASPRLAAIDIGSNSLHLVLAELDLPYGYRVLGRDKEMVRLGSGGYGQHRLMPEAVEAAIAALGRFVKLGRAHGIETFRAVATSAVREAANGGDFLDRVRRELGLRVKVITGHEEARLIYLAVRHAVDFGGRVMLCLDLGGGSLEIVSGTSQNLIRAESYKLGAGRLSELYLRSDPPSDSELAALRDHIARTLAPTVGAFEADKPGGAIGTSGTIQSLAEMCAAANARRDADRPDDADRLDNDDRADDRGHHRPDDPRAGRSDRPAGFSRGELAALYERLIRRNAAQRARLPGADPRRGDQIIAGAAVILMVMETLNLSEMECASPSLRDGIVVNYLERHQHGLQARRQVPDPRRRSVLYLAERCHWRGDHARQVARLALALFDQLGELHQLAASERELLEYAALLHDIGYLIEQGQHHRHSEYLIRHGGLRGFAPQEIEIMALVARYHRGGEPRPKADRVEPLAKPARRAVKRLAALLRIAEGLDRTHFSAVESLTARRGPDHVSLVVGGGDLELEIWAARRRRDLFESEWDLPLRIEHGDPNDATHRPLTAGLR